MANFGVSFNPGGDEPGASGDPAGQGASRLQQAVRLLNLRLPRVNVGGVAPNALMQANGGQPGMDSAMSLQALQRLMQMMAGLGGSPQAPSGASASAPFIAAGVNGPQALPPGGPTPGWENPTFLTPPGQPNLPSDGPAPGWQNPRLLTPPGPGNLPPGGPAPGWQNKKPKPKGPIFPPGPPNLPKQGFTNSGDLGPGNLPPGGPAPGWKNPKPSGKSFI